MYDVAVFVIAVAITGVIYIAARVLESARYEFPNMSGRRFVLLRCRSMMYFLSYPVQYPFRFTVRRIRNRYSRRFLKTRLGMALDLFFKGPKAPKALPKKMSVQQWKEMVAAISAAHGDYEYHGDKLVVYNGKSAKGWDMKSGLPCSVNIERPERSAQVKRQYRRVTSEEPPPPWEWEQRYIPDPAANA